ncbi:MAG TPA: hypothetical protein VEL76_34680 [Gemmataceae bacterium]|nr:hypothetical protein [Gemmataceae bacterium]
MATATPRTFNRAEADRRVRHPLHALRGTIRRYVTLEGLAVGILYLAIAFWVGLALDYGLFALLGIDWIKAIDRSGPAGTETSFWLRVVMLSLVIAGLLAVIAFKVLRRLFREFRDSALALVLERRFPKELGDRLITAVEMADPKLAEKYGFSQDMLDQTIRDAADRVNKLPVHEVFAWGRLYWRLAWAVLATVGVYLLVGTTWCITATALNWNASSPVAFFHHFNRTGGIWIDRNILLKDRAYWPVNELIDFVRFPGSKTDPNEMRVAREEVRPDIWFRAIKWARVERSSEAPEGLRALLWSDLPGLLGSSMPQVALPVDWPGWVIDMDDLDPSIPAGVIPADWNWHNKKSGAIRKELAAKRTESKQKLAALDRRQPQIENELERRRRTLPLVLGQPLQLDLLQPLQAKIEEQYRPLETAVNKTQGELQRLAPKRQQLSALFAWTQLPLQGAEDIVREALAKPLRERLAAQLKARNEVSPSLERVRLEVARGLYEVAQREQELNAILKDREGLAALAVGLDGVERMLDWRTWTVDKIELQLRKAPGVSQALRDGTRFALTEKAFASLRSAGVPDAVLAKFTFLQDREFATQEPFVLALAATLSKEELARFESLLLTHTRDKQPEAQAGFDKVFALLAGMVDDPSMRGVIRQLNIPERVTVTRQGKTSKNTSSRNLEVNNKYSFSLNDVKESVELTVSGDEYTTPPRKITLVPPPSIARLTIDKEEPAYLHYRLSGDEPRLKGKRQLFRGVPMSTTGTKTLIPVPLGSSLTVTAVADRDLKDLVRIAEPARRDEPGSFTPPVDARLQADKRTIEATFKHVTRVIEFDFEFRDTDNVKGRRHIVIKPIDDKAPTLVGVKLAALLRSDSDIEGGKGGGSKFGERLLITPSARVPFGGIVNDDRGLSRIEFPYKVIHVPFQKLGETGEQGKPEAPAQPLAGKDGKAREQFAQMIAGLYDIVPGAAAPRLAPGQLESITFLAILESAKGEALERPEKGIVELESFTAEAFRPRYDNVTLEEIDRLLQIQPSNRRQALRLLELKGENEERKFLEELKDRHQHEALLTDVIHFLKMSTTERSALLGMVKDQPAEAIRKLIVLGNADKEELEQVKQLLNKQPETALIREWSLDRGGRLLDKEAFDVQKYLPKLKAGSGESQQRHYEVHVFLTATDNNIETGPTTAPPKGPFVFLVISEDELLVEIYKQERKLYALLKEAWDGMKASKGALELEVSKLSTPNPDMVFMTVRADNARKSVRETGDIARGVSEKYNIILTEMEINRIAGTRIAKVAAGIVNPLASLTNKNDGLFPIVERTTTGAWKGLEEDLALLKKAEKEKAVTPGLLKELEEKRDLHRLELDRSVKQMTVLIVEVKKVLDAMQMGDEEGMMMKLIVDVEAARRENHRLIVAERQRILDSLFDPPPSDKKDKAQK